MSEKEALRRRIWAIEFALHELVLYLDANPECERALALMRKYRRMLAEERSAYEEEYGALGTAVADIEPSDSWKWINGPWPWENNFAEG